MTSNREMFLRLNPCDPFSGILESHKKLYLEI